MTDTIPSLKIIKRFFFPETWFLAQLPCVFFGDFSIRFSEILRKWFKIRYLCKMFKSFKSFEDIKTNFLSTGNDIWPICFSKPLLSDHPKITYDFSGEKRKWSYDVLDSRGWNLRITFLPVITNIQSCQLFIRLHILTEFVTKDQTRYPQKKFDFLKTNPLSKFFQYDEILRCPNLQILK